MMIRLFIYGCTSRTVKIRISHKYLEFYNKMYAIDKQNYPINKLKKARSITDSA